MIGRPRGLSESARTACQARYAVLSYGDVGEAALPSELDRSLDEPATVYIRARASTISRCLAYRLVVR